MACLFGMAMVMMGLGEFSGAFALLLGFHLYLWPSEITGVRWKHAISPAGVHCGGGSRWWAIILHLYEEGHPSKTNVYDECVMIDQDQFRSQESILQPTEKEKDPNARMLELKHHTSFASLFDHAARRLKLAPKPVTYQIRHSCPSHDRANHLRPVAEVKKRGRWASDSSVARYEKAGRVNEVFNKLGVETQQFCVDSVRFCGAALLQQCAPLVLPTL